MENKIRLMLVDDHEVVRVGLRSLLSMFAHIEVVAEASRADQCIEMVLQTHPDVILMDIRLPGKNGIEACREIKQEIPSIKLIMLTSYDSPELIQEAMLAGASGYVLKEISAQGLIETIESVCKGKTMVDQTIITKLAHSIKASAKEENLLADLTYQEIQVLKQISHGKTNQEIAKHMQLSEKTVRNYVSVILNKLNLHNRTEAAAFALRHHLQR